MKCEQFAEMLDRYEELTDGERAVMRAHAQECAECGRELDFMMSVMSVTKTLPELGVPDDFAEKLNARIDAEEKPLGRRGPVYHIRHNWQKYSAVAACLVVAAVIGANRDMLLDGLNGADDGVISTVTSTAAPAAGATALPQGTTAPSPLDNGTVIGDVEDRIKNETEGAPRAKGTNEDNIGFGRMGGINGAGTSEGSSSSRASSGQSASSGRTSSSGSAPSGGSSSAGASESAAIGGTFTSPVIQEPAADENAANAADTAQKPAAEDNAGIAPASETQPENDGQTIVLPRGVYVEGHGGSSTPEPDNGGAGGGDEGDAYAISGEGSTYAVARTGGEAPDDEQQESDPPEEEPEYRINGNSVLIINNGDYGSAISIIYSYISETYKGYYVIGSSDIYSMLAELSGAGIEYENYIVADADKVTFRVSLR